jgi:hypothetical protein
LDPSFWGGGPIKWRMRIFAVWMMKLHKKWWSLAPTLGNSTDWQLTAWRSSAMMGQMCCLNSTSLSQFICWALLASQSQYLHQKLEKKWSKSLETWSQFLDFYQSSVCTWCISIVSIMILELSAQVLSLMIIIPSLLYITRAFSSRTTWSASGSA